MVPELLLEAIGKSKAILTHFLWTKNNIKLIINLLTYMGVLGFEYFYLAPQILKIYKQ